MTFKDLGPWGHWILLALGVIAASLIAHRLLRPIVRRMSGWSAVVLAVVHRGDRPMQWTLPLAALQLLWEGLPDGLAGAAAVQHTNGLPACHGEEQLEIFADGQSRQQRGFGGRFSARR